MGPKAKKDGKRESKKDVKKVAKGDQGGETPGKKGAAAGKGASMQKSKKKEEEEEEKKKEQTYEVDSKCWALDGGQLYEAKVLKVDKAGGQSDVTSYFLHYQGWNSKWDKWVDATELMPDGKEAELLAKKLKAPTKTGKRGAESGGAGGEGAGGAAAGGGKGGGGGASSKKKAKVDLKADTVDTSGVPQVKLSIPFTLKKQLVTDWEFVTQEPRLLVPLPRTPSASAIMDAFIQSKKNGGDRGGKGGGGSKGGKSSSGANANASAVARFQELMEGIKIYFDRALPLILLYRQERAQYEKLIQDYPGRNLCELYGAEHLLRLFVRLPALMGQTLLNSHETTQVQTKIAEFLRFLQKGHDDFFLQQYEPDEDKHENRP